MNAVAHDVKIRRRNVDRQSYRRGVTPLVLMVAVGGLWVGLLGRLRRRRNDDGPRWYQLVYRLIYRLGFIVWNRAKPPAELVALVEGPSALPAGRALDLGCGTGTDTIYLATHGWDVTGVDMTPKALAIAQCNATAAGVTPRFIHGDVTRLDDLGVGDGYTLVLDFGCFHTLPSDRRTPYVTDVSHAAAPGATLLMFGFRRRGIAPMQAGMSVDEVRQRFTSADWELVNAERTSADEILKRRVGRAIDRFEPWRYQLRRTAS
jgi:SAM-dependent methyltransferase